MDDLISDPARISEIPTVEFPDRDNKSEDPVIAVYKCDKTASNASITKNIKTVEEGKVTQIDFSTHPDVLENAVIATRNYPNFSNDKELADALEISNIEAMKSMEKYSLGNRIKAFFFKLGWYNGYVTRLKEEGHMDENKVARTLLIRTREKQRSAQNTIRSMKTITQVLCSIMKRYPSDAIHEQALQKSVINAINSGQDLNPAIIEKIFKSGDLQEMPVINEILSFAKQNDDNK